MSVRVFFARGGGAALEVTDFILFAIKTIDKKKL
jgi:hypothetical protein